MHQTEAYFIESFFSAIQVTLRFQRYYQYIVYFLN